MAGTNEPRRQTKRGQLVDAVTMLVLIFATLFATTYLLGVNGTPEAAAGGHTDRSIAQLPITSTEKTHYRKMVNAGVTSRAEVVAAVDSNRPGTDKYPIDVPLLVGTVVLLGVYLGFVYRKSLRQYREVIENKFGPREGSRSL